MRTEALPRSSLSHSQHTDLQTQDEHPPANAPTPDPSSAWRTNRGEYTRRAPTMRREGPRASQTKIWPTPIALPRITWSRGEVRGGFSFCSKWSCSRSQAEVWKSESRTTKVKKWANVQFNIGWSFQHTVGKYTLAPSEWMVSMATWWARLPATVLHDTKDLCLSAAAKLLTRTPLYALVWFCALCVPFLVSVSAPPQRHRWQSVALHMMK